MSPKAWRLAGRPDGETEFSVPLAGGAKRRQFRIRSYKELIQLFGNSESVLSQALEIIRNYSTLRMWAVKGPDAIASHPGPFV